LSPVPVTAIEEEPAAKAPKRVCMEIPADNLARLQVLQLQVNPRRRLPPAPPARLSEYDINRSQ
jgi:hypothetical protein